MALIAPGALAIEDEGPVMEESFRVALVAGGLPQPLITYMQGENILSPADLPRYCGTGETGRQNMYNYLIQGVGNERDAEANAVLVEAL